MFLLKGNGEVGEAGIWGCLWGVFSDDLGAHGLFPVFWLVLGDGSVDSGVGGYRE